MIFDLSYKSTLILVLYGSETGDWGKIQDGVTVVKA
jgi:hypothetical protein